MNLSKFSGCVADNQERLTYQYLHLYWENPSANDFLLTRDRGRIVVFDGCRWREFDYGEFAKAAEGPSNVGRDVPSDRGENERKEAMTEEKRRDNGGRRSDTDRRQKTVELDFPDRRSGRDRRSGVDRRRVFDRRHQNGFRRIAGLGRRIRSGEQPSGYLTV